MTWKIVNVLAVVFRGVTFLSCMLVAPHTPMGGEILREGTSIVEEWCPKNCMLNCCFCWFLSLSRITVAECVRILWICIFYFCRNICVPDSLNVFHEELWRQFYVSSQWYLSAGQSIYCDILTVFKCIIQIMYYA